MFAQITEFIIRTICVQCTTGASCLMSTPHRRFFVCHATYHVTGNNDDCTEALKSLPPQAYDYTPDILCIAESCQVRLLQNINTAAGLVTSQSVESRKEIVHENEKRIFFDAN